MRCPGCGDHVPFWGERCPFCGREKVLLQGIRILGIGFLLAGCIFGGVRGGILGALFGGVFGGLVWGWFEFTYNHFTRRRRKSKRSSPPAESTESAEPAE
jgi:hypothetical protein